MTVLQLPTATVDLEQRTAERDGVHYDLTHQEADLLLYLAAQDRTVPRQELLQNVWGYAPSVKSRAVDSTVKRLRTKLESTPTQPQSLLSVRGKGYRLVCSRRPAPMPDLLGRQRERRALRIDLDRFGAVQLVGRGGAGKTALARELADERGYRFIDLSTARTRSQGVAVLAESIGLDLSRGAADRVVQRLVHAFKADRRAIVLDNLEQLEPAFTEVVMTLREAHVALVLTSRTITVNDWPVLALGALDTEAAEALLVRAAKRVHSEWRPPDTGLGAVVEIADGLPLALELLGSQLPLVDIEQLLDRMGSAMSVGDGRDGRHASVEASLRWSWSLFDASTRRWARWWSCFAGELPHPASAIATSEDRNAAQDDLERAGWLDRRSSSPRFWRSVQTFLWGELQRSGELEDARHAHAQCVLGLVPTDADGLDGDARRARLDDIDRWRADLEQILQQAPAVESRTRAGLLLLERESRLARNDASRIADQTVTLAVESGKTALEVAARLAQIRLSRRERDRDRDAGRFEAIARLIEAPSVSEGLRARFRLLRGNYLRASGRHEEALEDYVHGRTHTSRADLPHLGARLDHDEGATLRRIGRLDEAEVCFERCVEVSTALGDPVLASQAVQALTSIERGRGNLVEAIDLGRRAVALGRRANDPYALGGALTNLANACLAFDDHDAAAELNREAANVLRAGGYLTTLSIVLGNLSCAVERSGDWVEAELLNAEAMELAYQVGAAYPAAVWRSRMADLMHRQGQLDAALEHYQVAIAELSEQAAHPQLEHTMCYAAVALAELSRFDEADHFLDSANALCDAKIHDRAIHLLVTAAVAVLRGESVRSPLHGHEENEAWAASESILATAWALWLRAQR